MQRIIIVEEDPIVALDLLDMLRPQFGEGVVEQLTLDAAILSLAEYGAECRDGRAALVIDRLPEDFAAVRAKLPPGLRLVVTNAAAAPHATDGAIIIERPFDPSAIVGFLNDGSTSVSA